MLDTINRRMTGDGVCPTRGSLGECPAMTMHDAGPCGEPAFYTAFLHIWDKEFNDGARVAGWFYELGAEWVEVLSVLHDKNNDIECGVCALDGTRSWRVDFGMPTKTETKVTTPKHASGVGGGVD